VVDLDLVKQNGDHLPVRLLHRIAFSSEGVTSSSRTLVLNRSPGEDSSEALRAAEVQFARYFNNTPIGIAGIGKNGQIGRCNSAFLRAFPANDSPEETREARLPDLVSAADRPKIEEMLTRLVQGEREFEPVEIMGLAADDAPKSFQLYCNAVSDTEAAEDAELAIVYVLETTQQRALEQQFAQSQKMQAIGQLAGGIAHDFNNVLTAIIGYSDLLLANHPAGDPSFNDIKSIQQNAHRAARLVGQLLAFSRQQTLRPEVLSLTDVLADIPDMVDRLLGEKSKLSVLHGRDLWPIKADANQLGQVIVNLAVNARDAMPNGGTITITTENLAAADCGKFITKGMPAADYVHLAVADEGTGMSKELMEKIFDPFFTTKEVGKGTGLGLATVYGIIKQTGGFIYPESTLDEGTTFRIFLPRHILTERELARPVEEDEKKEESRDLTGSATILLVEDEEAVRSFSARALSSRGYTVLEAESGSDALDVMDGVNHEVDLVVSDVVMPEMNGPTMLGILREKNPDLKVIFVSGYAEEAFKNDLPENEAFSFLPKPFSLKQLTATVRDVLDGEDQNG
jgi:two-component system cell cycle sensor histidine kinase/response regulator CckA